MATHWFGFFLRSWLWGFRFWRWRSWSFLVRLLLDHCPGGRCCNCLLHAYLLHHHWLLVHHRLLRHGHDLSLLDDYLLLLLLHHARLDLVHWLHSWLHHARLHRHRLHSGLHRHRLHSRLHGHGLHSWLHFWIFLLIFLWLKHHL